MSEKKILKLAYVDFWSGFDSESFFITKALKKKYEIVFDNNNPNFVICGSFGNKYLSYECPRLYYTGEANCPDFNIYDYANIISFEMLV